MTLHKLLYFHEPRCPRAHNGELQRTYYIKLFQGLKEITIKEALSLKPCNQSVIIISSRSCFVFLFVETGSLY